MSELWDSLTPAWQSAFVVVAAGVAYFVCRWLLLRPLARIAHSTENDLDDRLVQFASQFLGIVIVFVAVIGVLKVHDVAISPLLAGAGIVGIAIGFAAKETLADVLAGIFLIADRPMRIGDRVKIEFIGREWGSWGDVVDIGLRRTTVRNTDGVIVNYPNNMLSNSVITNFSFEPGPNRVRVRFQVGYSADLPATKEIARAAITETDGVLPETTDVLVRSLWDDQRGHALSGILLEGRYRIEDIRKRSRIRSAVLERLHEALRAGGVPLASPLLTVQQAVPEAG